MWYDVITRQNYQLVQWKTGIFFFYRAFIANTEIIILLLFLYFTQMHDIISQYDGLAIGAPSSGLIAELVLQHTKNTHLAWISQKQKIINYFRYVDDILLIFDSNHTYIQAIVMDLQHFTPESEIHSRNWEGQHHKLLRHIHPKTPNNLKTSIYRKPTFTDTIIPYTSNTPQSTNMQLLNFSVTDWTLTTFKNKNTNKSSVSSKTYYTTTRSPTHHRNNMTTFYTNFQTQVGHLYIHGQRDAIHYQHVQTHGLKNSLPNNTLEILLKHRKPPPDKFALSGMYKLTCRDCNKAYMGQTVRSFSICYKEHKSAFHNNSHTSNFAQHLREEAHSFGLINIMQVLHHQRKGVHLNTIERFYIHKEHAAGNHLNDNHTIFPNKISDSLIQK